MQQSKLIRLLQSFSREEQQRFLLFAQSPYFNVRKNAGEVQALLTCLLDRLQQPDQTLDKAQIYTQLYPEQRMVTGKLEKLMSQLYQLGRRFVEVDFAAHQQTTEHATLTFLQFCRERRLDKQTKSLERQLQREWQARTQLDLEDFALRYAYEKQLSDFLSTHDDRQNDHNLPATLKTLDHNYVIARLEYAVKFLAIDLFISPQDTTACQRVTDHLLKLDVDIDWSIPLLAVYREAYGLLRAEDARRDQHYNQFLAALHAHEKHLPIAHLKSLHTLIRNYCLLRYHRGETIYLERAFELYRHHLESGFLYYNGKIMPGTLNNIVVSGMRCGAADWVYQFLQNHRSRIEGTDFPERVYQFNLAYYYFCVRDFRQAIPCLSDTYEDRYYKLAARRLEIMIYYEMESDLLEPRMDAFKILVYRISDDQLTQKQLTGNRNFIGLLRQIRMPSTWQNDRRIEKLRQKILQTPHLAESDWLLTKLMAMR